MEQLLHVDFVEFGSSGRRSNRSEMIDTLVSATDHGRIDVSEVTVRHLAGDVILATYQSRTGERSALRSSVWIKEGGRWQIVFHQGTPAARA